MVTANPKPSPRGSSFHTPKRPPLLPAPNNARQQAREVTSRYLSSPSLSSSFSSNSSSASSLRSHSPMKPTTPRRHQVLKEPPATPRRQQASKEPPATPAPSSRRSQSVERRRTPTPMPLTSSNAARVLMTSTRSLSVSFQGEAFKLPVSKAKPAPSPSPAPDSVRRGTPERRKGNQREEGKIGDQYRWPGRSKGGNSSVLTRSLDFGADKAKLFGSGNGARDLQNSVIKTRREIRLKSEGTEARCTDGDDKSGSISIKLADCGISNSDSVLSEARLKNGEVTRNAQCTDGANSRSISTKSADCGVSDSDSVSSGSTLGGSVARARGGLRGIVVPARFLEGTNSRLRKEEMEPGFGTPKSKNSESRTKGLSTPTGTKKCLPPVSLSKAESVSGRFTSPIRGGTPTRLASISKGLFPSVNSPSPRGRPSPTRTRNGKPDISEDINTPSVLSFTADMRKVRVGENRVNDAHELRMLYNRQLQWRFVNARTEAAHFVQSGTAERSLYNAWVTISKLRHSIRSKKIQLQLLRHNLKLYSILKEQAPYLESWSLIDSHHCISLSEARQALQTSIANLPLVGGATADIQLLKNAICSAADVMQGMTSSAGSHLIKVEQVSLLASELANTTANEIAFVDQGKNLLSGLVAMQGIVQEAKAFDLGENKYSYYFVTALVSISWQCYILGTIGVIFCSSSLLCGILLTCAIPLTEMLGVFFFDEKFNIPKGISLVLSIWGFLTYFYGEFKYSNEANKSSHGSPLISKQSDDDGIAC